jgi:diguanylate cyclase (GGDEF)-like protein
MVHISDNPLKLENFQVGYFIDHTEKLTLEEVEKERFKPIGSRFSLGTDADVTWVKIRLQNDSNSTRHIFIHNIFTYLSYETSFYEVLRDRTIREVTFIPPLNKNTENLKGAEAVYPITLDPRQRKTLYMRSHFKAYQIVALGIYDHNHSQQNLIRAFMPAVVMVTILMTLAVYYFLLFLYGRYKEYIYYSLYLVSSSIFIAYTYGALTHYYYIYGNMALMLNAVTILPPVFLSLFTKTIFATKTHHVWEDRILNSFILLFFVTYLYSFFHYYKAIEFASLLYLYFFFGMLWIALSLFRKKVPLVGYFLLAHMFYLAFSLVAILFYSGILPFNNFTLYALGLGSMVEAFMLGFLLSHRVRLLENENRRKDELLIIEPMTGLYNKSFFDMNLKRNIIAAREEGDAFALMIIDIDYFKQFNDTYGHLEGDRALIAVADVLTKSLRRSDDIVFRIGGEEFAVFTKRGVENVHKLGEKILDAVRELRIEHKKSDIADYLTISIGIHIADKTSRKSASDVYRAADEALYRAKSQGRNRMVLSSEA